MKTISQILNEKIVCPSVDTPVTARELKQIEKQLDALFADIPLDIEFTKHFLDRLNDKRNKTQITACELIKVYQSAHDRFKSEIAEYGKKTDIAKLIRSNSTRINIPVKFKWNASKGEIEMVAVTIMRTRDFKGKDKQMRVESTETI